VRFAGKSDKGLSRTQNEDAYCIVDLTKSSESVVMAVADGMGGHRAGNIASKMAIEHIVDSITNDPLDVGSYYALTERLGTMLKETNEEIFVKSLTDHECDGMGTTLTIAVTGKTQSTLAHVGDSCAFLFHGETMNKITTDHTYVEELVKTGTLTREQANKHPQRNYITKAVGCFERVIADYYSVDMAPGDRMLLCSDGLNKMLDDEVILKIVNGSDDPDQICSELVNEANRQGGVDNITVVVFLNIDRV